MNAKEFIEKYLRDCQYGNKLTREAENIAKDSNLVVVFGASDDLCEFRGAVDDEVDCYDGGDIYINKDGKILDVDFWETDELDPEDYPDYHLIKAVWCDKDAGCAWSYKTDIPHEEFLIYEDDELYCRGIVFSLDDIQPDKLTKCKICECERNCAHTVRIFAGTDDPGQLIDVCADCHRIYWNEMRKCMVKILSRMSDSDTERREIHEGL